jgi:hypothetical protein
MVLARMCLTFIDNLDKAFDGIKDKREDYLLNLMFVFLNQI